MTSDPAPRRASRFGLILPFVLFLLLIALYSGFWMVVRGQFEKTVDDWIAAETAAGSVLEYSQKTIGGYPFRVALTLDDATYESADKSLRYAGEVTQVVNDLFPLFLDDPALLPDDWRADVARVRSKTELARVVLDYVAGMTDRFALQEHDRLFQTGHRPDR